MNRSSLPWRPLAAAVATLAVASAAPAAAQAKQTTSGKASPAKVTHSTPVTPGSKYLALGDSVTFGYMEPNVVPAPDYQSASSFDGYPEILASELHLKVANAACPGETSASLIDATAASNGCENAPATGSPVYRRLFPLHVKYRGSQLGYAVKYLRSHHGVRLVSLMIGANDFFVCQETTADKCTSPTEELGVLSAITKNVHTIVSAIRHNGHYHGQLVMVDYYSLNYASPTANLQSQALNKAEAAGARGMHVRFANGYLAFKKAAVHSGSDTCTAGLLTQLGSPTSCGVHPSVAGQTVLASTVARAVKLG